MSQFDFIGSAYSAANPMQDDQVCINWYLETDRTSGAKTPKALLGCPGKSQAVDTSAYSGAVRGAHVMPGALSCYWVIGSQVVKMTIATQATASAYATFTLTTIGSIETTSGPVAMRDNGVANQLVIVDGKNMYVVNHTQGTMKQVTDSNVSNPSSLMSIDGTIYFNKGSSQQFNATPIYWNGTDAFDGTAFALKDDAPDQLVAMIENTREAWLIGEATTEVWYAGATGVFPLSRLQGAMLQVGCSAPATVVRTGHGLMWLGNSERGGGTSVVMTQGYDFKVISSYALSYALTQYKVISDAFAYVYTEEGHEFYVLTFPTQDVTWVFDLTTEEWHQRAYMDGYSVMHRDRANCLANFAGQRLVGDYANGKIYRQARDIYVDGDAPLVAIRRTPYAWDEDDRNRLRHNRLQVEFTPGVGNPTGQGSDPLMMLRWRDENGWSNEREIPIGKIGETRNRAIARKLGAARYRVYEVRISDPVKRDIVGASLKAGGQSA